MSEWELRSSDHGHDEQDPDAYDYDDRPAGLRGLASRLKSFLWGPSEEGDYDDYGDAAAPQAYDRDDLPPLDAAPPPAPVPARPTSTSRGKPSSRPGDEVIELRPPRQPVAEIQYPRTLDDMQQWADMIRDHSLVIIDLEQVSESERLLMVYYLCGIVSGLRGTWRRINDLTYVFAPRHFVLESNQSPRASTEPSFLDSLSRLGT